MARSTFIEPSNTNRRRSIRFRDKFNELPDELILTILSKFQDDIKTLLRCSSVCKKLNALVSKIDTLFFRFSYPSRKGVHLPCWNSHFHIPLCEMRGALRVFSNLKSLMIKVCLCPSAHSDCHVFKFKSLETPNGKMKTQFCAGAEVGLLWGRRERLHGWVLKEKLHRMATENGYWMSVLSHELLDLGPKTLSNVVVLGSTMEQGSKSHEKVFLGSQQLVKLFNLYKELDWRLNLESWVQNSENVTYWLKDQQQQNEVGFAKRKAWVVHKWEISGSNESQSIVKEADVEDLMDAFDDWRPATHRGQM